MIDEPESPTPDHITREYAVGCEDCEILKDARDVPRTVELVSSEYGGGLVCEKCANRRRGDALADIGNLVINLRELGWSDVAELVIRRNLSPVDRLFRRLEEFIADERASQYPTSREKPNSRLPRRGL
jgi:hypothetical protein